MSENHLSDLRFDSLDLHESILTGIRDSGFEFCTPIQANTLPIALKPSDVAGQAQTGTGKTAAFLIAAYQRLMTSEVDTGKTRQPRVFILAPTRELAVQIANDAEVLGKHTGLKIGLAYGGTDYDKQRKILQDGVDLLIGTPGRIIDYYKQGVFKLDHVQVAILDEADRMFDLGFIKDIRYLLRRLPEPEKRLNMLFSATLSQRVMELAYEHMNEPELIRIEPDKVTADRVRQAIFYPANEDKLPLLKADAAAEAKKGFEAKPQGSDVFVPVDTIDWSGVTKRNFNYLLRQRPGENNALGQMKFMLPNQNAVYLHDTPGRELFGKQERSFSSGCVRLERPRDLASWLLSREGNQQAGRLSALLDSGETTTVYLKEPVPVYLVYFTAFVTDDGDVAMRRDIYGRDKVLVDALRGSES